MNEFVAVVQLLSPVWIFVATWTAAFQAPLSSTNSQSLLSLMPIELVLLSNHLTLWYLLLLLPSVFLRDLSNELALCIRWPKYWNFSISPSNEYSGLISLKDWLVWSHCSPRDPQEASPTPQFKSINSLALSFLYSPTCTSIHDHWKNHRFD